MNAARRPHTFYTIGHSTRSVEEFLHLLQRHRINLLVDVRRYPASRRHPHFAQEALAEKLAERGIEYIHEINLGGRRRARKDSVNTGWESESFRGYADYMDTQPFQEALVRLEQYAATGTPALMCAEAVPWRCHRQLIADALIARGHNVRDIIGDKEAAEHKITAFAKVQENTQVLYPAPQGELPLEE